MKWKIDITLNCHRNPLKSRKHGLSLLQGITLSLGPWIYWCPSYRSFWSFSASQERLSTLLWASHFHIVIPKLSAQGTAILQFLSGRQLCLTCGTKRSIEEDVSEQRIKLPQGSAGLSVFKETVGKEKQQSLCFRNASSRGSMYLSIQVYKAFGHSSSSMDCDESNEFQSLDCSVQEYSISLFSVKEKPIQRLGKNWAYLVAKQRNTYAWIIYQVTSWR